MSNYFYSLQEFIDDLTKQEIFVGNYSSPYGSALIYATSNHLVGLYFTNDENEKNRINQNLSQKYSLKKFTNDKNIINDWGRKIFESNNQKLSFKITGTDFQLKVWQELINIPFGQTTTYSQIALALHHPKALRAVGTAVGANPLSFVIPCHRVLRHNSDLGGYRWGSDLKQKILRNEIKV